MAISFDQVTTTVYTLATSLTIDHSVHSQDQVLVVLFRFDSTAGITSLTYNGVPLQLLVDHSQAVSSQTDASIWLMLNPPVGTYPITATLPNANGFSFTALTISGINKKAQNFNTAFSDSGASSTALLTTTINVPIANSLVLVAHESGNNAPTPRVPLVQIGGNADYAFPIATGTQTFQQDITADAWTQVVAVFEPSDAPSIWHPTVQLRTIKDEADMPLPVVTASYGYKQPPFFQNSFFHTIGRIVHPLRIPLPENEFPTSQFVVDKVFQGQSSAGTALNMQVNIPSQDATLVVTGGSVIATGGAWQSVKFNGNSLTKLAQVAQTNSSAEIWWMPNPPVGVYTLTITPTATTGQAYANAMVILGIDKKDTNIITATATDAASISTITANITPDAPNVLLIDCIAAIDATAAPIPDQNQTQVFNATAINAGERILSTYKIGNIGLQNMNYDLSITAKAALVVAAFRPANAASLWFPNIDARTIDDVVTPGGLDAGISPATGQYGYKPSLFYQNSFLHTIGRKQKPVPPVTTANSTFLLLGVG